jgi:hypothetical protein
LEIVSNYPAHDVQRVDRDRNQTLQPLPSADQMARQLDTKRVASTGSAGALLAGNTSWYWRFI